MKIKDLLSKAAHMIPHKDLIEGKRLDFKSGEITFIQPIAEETQPGSGRYNIFVVGQNTTTSLSGGLVEMFRNGHFKKPCCLSRNFERDTARLMVGILDEQFQATANNHSFLGIREEQISDFAPLSNRQLL